MRPWTSLLEGLSRHMLPTPPRAPLRGMPVVFCISRPFLPDRCQRYATTRETIPRGPLLFHGCRTLATATAALKQYSLAFPFCGRSAVDFRNRRPPLAGLRISCYMVLALSGCGGGSSSSHRRRQTAAPDDLQGGRHDQRTRGRAYFERSGSVAVDSSGNVSMADIANAAVTTSSTSRRAPGTKKK